MIARKCTHGVVVQRFNTDLGYYLSQEFICGDVVEYVNENGGPIDPNIMHVKQENGSMLEPYLPYDMIQPDMSYNEIVKHVAGMVMEFFEEKDDIEINLDLFMQQFIEDVRQKC